MSPSTRTPHFTAAQVEALAHALGDTESGLTGSEIGQMLSQARIPDVDPEITKWKRIFNALVDLQNRDGAGTCVLNFVRHALEPARYVDDENTFKHRQYEVNRVLAFVGLRFSDAGQFVKVASAKTIPEAQQRADRLKFVLEQRAVHPDVLRYCTAELVADDYFHAVLEATKSVAAKLRTLGQVDLDGGLLADAVLGGSAPRVHINAFATASERSEQSGFTNLVKGLFGTFRNPTAHEARIAWTMSEADALDLMTTASYVHRRLDFAT